MAYGIFRKVSSLEFFQHHIAKSGHGDGLLMTRQLISTVRQPPLHYLTRSVRRTSGFVLADHTAVVGRGCQDTMFSSYYHWRGALGAGDAGKIGHVVESYRAWDVAANHIARSDCGFSNQPCAATRR